MKNNVLLLLMVFGLTTALPAQTVFSMADKLKPQHWNKGTVLRLEGKDLKVEVTAKYFKDKSTKTRFKFLQLNDEKFKIIRKDGAIYIKDKHQNTLLGTNRKREVVALNNDQLLTVRKRMFNNTYEYHNANGEMILSGKLKDGIVTITTNYNEAEGINALIAFCFVELAELAFDRWASAIVIVC